jgi:hypothetical protein
MSPIDDRTVPMTLAQLQTLLDAYGANPDHWPSEARAPALALLDGSAEARRQRDRAGELDALLDLVPAAQPSPDLRARALAGAPRAPSVGHRAAVHRWRLAAAIVPLAAAAAAVIWLVPRYTETASQPMQVAIEDLGTYTMPTDVLLQPSGLDMLRSAPSIGCGTDGLACVITETNVGPQSLQGRQMRGMA